jgi:molybdate transport system substrate-binding protein
VEGDVVERPLIVMSTLAVELALQSALLPAWRETRGDVEVEWSPTGVLIDRVRAGERGDVLIAIDAPIAQLVQQGVLRADSVRPLARASFGLGVKRGEPLPDISTPDRFREALLSARSVAYSLTGASGIHFQDVMERLDITQTAGARATAIHAGFTADRVIAGDADLAVQQISELMSIDGIDVVGPFPGPLQKHTDFSGAIFTDSRSPDVAEAFLDHLTDATAAEVYARSGLLPRTGGAA